MMGATQVSLHVGKLRKKVTETVSRNCMTKMKTVKRGTVRVVRRKRRKVKPSRRKLPLYMGMREK